MRTTTTAPAAAKSKYVKIAAIASLSSLLALGVFAANGWLPRTDPLSGKEYGWFGSESSPPSEGGAAPAAGGGLVPSSPPSGTPQLSKEYIYAGSRLLAVEDANAAAAPPADIAVWRPSNGYWMVMGQAGSQATTFNWGIAADVPVPGDYDGDGETDFSVYRPSSGEWWVFYSATATYGGYQWGNGTDRPAPADFDGDGRTDFAIYRPGTGQWFVLYTDGSAPPLIAEFGIGASNDAPRGRGLHRGRARGPRGVPPGRRGVLHTRPGHGAMGRAPPRRHQSELHRRAAPLRRPVGLRRGRAGGPGRVQRRERDLDDPPLGHRPNDIDGLGEHGRPPGAERLRRGRPHRPRRLQQRVQRRLDDPAKLRRHHPHRNLRHHRGHPRPGVLSEVAARHHS